MAGKKIGKRKPSNPQSRAHVAAARLTHAAATALIEAQRALIGALRTDLDTHGSAFLAGQLTELSSQTYSLSIRMEKMTGDLISQAELLAASGAGS